MNKKIVSIYSFIHFVVDFSCAVSVTNFAKLSIRQPHHLLVSILLYNFFAFAMQLPIGIIADRINKNAVLSATGCLFVAFSFGFLKYGIISCVIAGIGNAMFHIGGGIDVLNISENKAALSGIFVSTGAMGIFLGTKAQTMQFVMIYAIIFLLLSAILLLYLYEQIKNTVKNKDLILPVFSAKEKLSIICLFLTVCIRSYIGLITAFEWKQNSIMAFLAILAIVIGKILGGIIGDKIGFKTISVASLAISAVCFLFAFSMPAIGITAMLFFNMTMPITLTVLTAILKNKGMAFGLLTSALYLGAIPHFFDIRTDIMFTPIGLCFLTIISLFAIYIALRKYHILTEEKNDTQSYGISVTYTAD